MRCTGARFVTAHRVAPAGSYQHRTEWTVSGLRCGAGELDAASQMLHIDVSEDHKPEVYGP
jgi:hypothetical protein